MGKAWLNQDAPIEAYEALGSQPLGRRGVRADFARGIEERFWEKVDKGYHCWGWCGPLAPSGYGKFMFRGDTYVAHRVAYRLTVGPLHPPLVLDHLCRNRSCVRPDHLEEVSIAVNVKRGGNSLKIECEMGHPLVEAEVYVSKAGRRQCRECSRRRDRERNKKRYGGNGPRRGESHPHSKLNEELVRDLRSQYSNGTPIYELIERFGIHRNTVKQILNGETWKHIT